MYVYYSVNDCVTIILERKVEEDEEEESLLVATMNKSTPQDEKKEKRCLKDETQLTCEVKINSSATLGQILSDEPTEILVLLIKKWSEQAEMSTKSEDFHPHPPKK